MPSAADLPSWAPKYLSYSAAGTIDHCARQWVHRYRDKIRGGPKDYLILGNFVHAVLEHSVLEGIHEPGPLKELARRLFVTEVTPSDEWCQLWPDEAKFRAESWRHIVRAKRAEAAGLLAKPRWVEMEFRLTLNGVPFYGKADRIGELGGLWVPEDWKGLALDTPLPTTTGWTTMGSVRVGDELFDIDGAPAQVTAKSEIHMNPCYRITFDDASELVADHEHRWVVERRDGTEAVMTTEEIAAMLADRREDGGYMRFRQPLKIRVAGALCLGPADLPVDPYVVGLWLADGHARGDGLTLSESKLGALDELRRAGFEPHEPAWSQRHRAESGSGGFFIHVPGLASVLRSAGILGHRTIPESYLRGSEAQRLALLRGLMDGDGNFNRRRQQAGYESVSKALAHQVLELVLSLGWRATLAEFETEGFGKKVTAYRVSWRPWRVSPFHARTGKDHLPLDPGRKGRHRWIRSIEQIDTVPTQCITVDSPSHTYLAGISMIPTHNTGAADKYLPAQGRTPEMTAKMEKDRLKKLFQNPIYGAALEQSTDLKVGDGRFVFTSTDPVTIIESPKSLEGQALDWLAQCWDKVHEAVKLGDDTKASTGPLCSWCDAVDVCPEGRKHVAWMINTDRKISEQTVAMLRRLSEPRELDDWVKFGHVRKVEEEEVYVAITPSFRRVTTGDRWALRDGETPLEPPTVGELRSELAQVIASREPNLDRVRFLEAALRRRGFEVESWVPSAAPAKAKPKRRKVQSATARTKAAATKKTTTRRRKKASA